MTTLISGPLGFGPVIAPRRGVRIASTCFANSYSSISSALSSAIRARERQGGEGTVDQLPRAQREVTGHGPDLIPACREALAQVVDREHELRRVEAVHPPGRIDRSISEVLHQCKSQRGSSRLLHVHE